MDFDQVLQRLDRFLGANPVFASDVYVASNATVLGKVSIGSGSSVMAAQAAPQARQRETYTVEHSVKSQIICEYGLLRAN